MNSLLRTTALAGLLVSIFSGSKLAGADLVRITLVGDSMMADQPPERPIQGWGTYLQGKLNDAQITNLAMSGRSTKTFLAEANWPKVQSTPADYWLISFGANDSHAPDKPEHTDPADYAKNLEIFVNTARSLDVKPVLLTPIHRRLRTSGKLSNELEPYSDAMKDVASRLNVPVIDLHKFSGDWYTSEGLPAINAYVPPDLGSHFNKAGAEYMAQEVANRLSEVEPRLAKAARSPTPAAPH